MPTPLANNNEGASSDLDYEYGLVADDPANRAFVSNADPFTFTAPQTDMPGLPVERVPSRLPRGGVALSFPTIDDTGVATQWTGVHGAMPTPNIGSRSPDVQPPEPAFRRQQRNAPDTPWDEGTALPVAAYAASPYGGAVNPDGMVYG